MCKKNDKGRDMERDLSSADPSLPNGCTSLGWARQKQGAWTSILVSHVGGEMDFSKLIMQGLLKEPFSPHCHFHCHNVILSIVLIRLTTSKKIFFFILDDVYLVDQDGKDPGLGKSWFDHCFQTFYFLFLFLGGGGDKGRSCTQPPNHLSIWAWGVFIQCHARVPDVKHALRVPPSWF